MDDICQCCLSGGGLLKGMTEPYIVGNKIEIYYDMLNKCFTDNLIRETADDVNCNLLICDDCVDKLRDCLYFRRQVERVQEKLHECSPLTKTTAHCQYNKGGQIHTNDTNATEIKVEESGNEESTDEFFMRQNVVHQNGDISDQPSSVTTQQTENRINEIKEKHAANIERKIRNSLAKIRPSEINDKLILSEGDETTDPLRKESNLSVDSCEQYEALHQKIVNLVTIPDLKINCDVVSVSNCVKESKKKRHKMSKEERRKKTKSYLRKHRLDLKPYKLNESDNKCGVCQEEFNSHQSLVAHMNDHYPQYICDKCGKGFAVRSALRAHVRIHDEGVPCEICNKKIMKRNLSKHVNAHLGKKDVHRCPICNERFEKFSSRALHMEKEHDIIKRYKCKWCDKVFNLAANLNLHVRDQHNPFVRMQIKSQNLMRKPRASCFECEPCGKTFKQKLHLEHHQISKHSNEKNYQCHICLRSYFLKYTLNQHMKDYHYETAKYSCNICNKVFKVKRMVTRHIKRVHNKQNDSESGVELEPVNIQE